MRPRRFRRGTMLARPDTSPLRAGFNEAPAISPGNPGTTRRRGHEGVDGFNEAPAISPGNPARTLLLDGALSSFNEAPAISPGNLRLRPALGRRCAQLQ